MNINSSSPDLEMPINSIYENDEKVISLQRNRYRKLADSFKERFGIKSEKYFSAPGRIEIGGNHTDHNHGKVIAASIDLDAIAVASRNNTSNVVLYSEQYLETFNINLDITEPVESEKATTAALIRGIAAGLKNNGYNIDGFNASISSDVLIGSGLSSSASIEILIGTIFNHFYNKGKVPTEAIAKIGQYAENNYFGKPCGLMDQLACAIGGMIEIDFSNPENPGIKKIEFDFHSAGYKILVVDTEADHANLTEEYAAIPEEMKQVANYFNKEFCSKLSLEELIQNIKSLRENVSDRAILRAIHFLEENKRVEEQVNALKKNDFNVFLRLVNQSGNSSFKYLQNIYSTKNASVQNLSLALVMTDLFIKEKGKGACRVHGGGFAGTILVFLPQDVVEEYKSYISKIFNESSVNVLSLRNIGAICINKI